ncbi:MAG: protein phosphatase CheZ [Pseudomonadota bacterium]
MTTHEQLVSIDEAKELLSLLENGEIEAANDIVHSFKLRESESDELFSEVGKLTRQLHNSLVNFQLDKKLAQLTQESIPDAQSRLEYVISETEKAANSTMDAVERSMPIAEQLNERFGQLIPNWKKLMHRQLELGEFKTLCHEMDKLLLDAQKDSATLNSMLTEVLMAQGYQDLTGQVIRRVIELVAEVETGLVDMLATFSEHDLPEIEEKPQPLEKKDDKVEAEGPIMNAEGRDDVVQSQDDVDDLLSSLGF